jgi:hypothetical protein
MAQLRWQEPADGSDTLAIAQIRWYRTFTDLLRGAVLGCAGSGMPGGLGQPDAAQIREVGRAETV